MGYNTRLFRDKVRARFQLNVKNVQENGGGFSRRRRSLMDATAPIGSSILDSLFSPHRLTSSGPLILISAVPLAHARSDERE